jgi:hypothetical protein
MDNKAEIKAACMELFLINGKDRGTIVHHCDDMPHYYLLRPDEYITDIKPLYDYFEFVLTEKAIDLINEIT